MAADGKLYWKNLTERGGGLSYSEEVSQESINPDQLIPDTYEITNYLWDRFNKDKIYSMAHSGGTPIALSAVAGNPELFEAYMGMAPITNQKRDKLSKLKASNNLDTDADIRSFYSSGIRNQSMHG